MEKIIGIACLKTGLMFFVALVFIRYGLIGSVEREQSRLIVLKPRKYWNTTFFFKSFESLGKDVKLEEYHPYSATLYEPSNYNTKQPIRYPQQSALFLFVLTAILISLSVLCLTIRDSLIIKGHEFYKWIPTQATIQDIETRQHDGTEIRKLYTYEIDGITYDNRYSIIQEWEDVYFEGSQTFASFRAEIIGQPFNIVYNSKNPRKSIEQQIPTDYHDIQLEPELRSKARYGAYLASIIAGAVVFPAALNLLFAQRGHGLDANV
ncbi:MAG: hypothetical protein HY862_02565 [Chloroflexi bacterium]|nr:hypothetical protein [Chloroflexota bacterium]